MSIPIELIKQRGNLKRKLTCFTNFIRNTLDNNPDVNLAIAELEKLEIIERMEKIKVNFDAYDEIQDKIDEFTVEPKETTEYRSDIETNYFSVLANAKHLLSRGAPKNVPPTRVQCGFEMPIETTIQQGSVQANGASAIGNDKQIIIKSTGLQLPQIELPKFNGELSNWLGFRDTFESLIHKNNEISEIEKFHYLVAALKDSAKQVIDSLEFTSTNYVVAWDALCSRYNNKRLLIQNHIKTIFDMEQITKESSIQIRKMLDNLNKHTRALMTLGQSTENWDSLLIYLLALKLDNNTARAWEKNRSGNEIPTLFEFKNFLQSHASLLETLEINNLKLDKESKLRPENKGNFQSKKVFLAQRVSCALCKEHHIQNCSAFLSLNPQERSEKVRNCRLCLNCLRPGHYQQNCKSKGCMHCQARHNTLLHFEKSKSNKNNSASESKDRLICSATTKQSSSEDGVLSTASVFVRDNKNKQRSVRILLDSGSQCNLITSELCDLLKLKKTPIDINIGSISEASLVVKHKCELEIASQVGPFKARISCLVVSKINTESPKLPCSSQSLRIPSHIKLADPNFERSGTIDIFLGNAIFWSLICVGQIKLNEEGLILQKTRLGWILAGPMPSPQLKTITCNAISKINVEKQLIKFWELEECAPNKQTMSNEEQLCEESFVKNVKRNKDGRFVVKVPLKEDPHTLGDSKQSAKFRFLKLENKLAKNPKLREEYHAFIQEYIQLGHMIETKEEIEPAPSYYFPHHCIIRPESSSTKLRVVFDGSAPSDSGVSYNGLQMVGPTVQNDLFSILVRFRKHAFVVGGDIEKMYRQILINPEQHSLQRILWRFDEKEPIKTYELITVTYGTASASFLAIRCLMELASECEKTNPITAKTIRRDFYVDDMLTGADAVEEATLLAKNVAKILATGCLNLRKWVSNSPEIIKEVTDSQEAPELVNLSWDKQVKTLGLHWQTNPDIFKYSVNISIESKVTKRQILAEISQIFDPLGLISPCVILVKMMLQRLWMEKLSWDETLPYELHNQWTNYKRQLPSLNDLKIPRHVICLNPVNVELHGFSDASQEAYGGCIYIRSQDISGKITVRLLCAKSKVAPVKTQTIPRLELCGAVLLAKLSDKVQVAIDRPINGINYWTDSTIVLSWINKHSKNIDDTFVSNRVSQIQQMTDIKLWRHVATRNNPADYLSRGLNPNQIANSKPWWSGPEYLSKEKSEWPKSEYKNDESSAAKLIFKIHKISEPVPEIDDSIITRANNLSSLVRVVARIKRLANNYKIKDNKIKGPLSTKELREAFLALLRLSQRASFQIEIAKLNQKEAITKGKLASLNPFLDETKTLRVGDRLENSKFSEDKKHPIVIDAKHKLTKLIFQHDHIKLLHAPPQLLLASIRETLWPLGGRNLARKTVLDCMRCARAKPNSMTPMMGNLPLSRVSPYPPFYNTGVDYAGPFSVKDRRGRGCKITKAYVSLFVCFTTKALHLELVSDATSEAFIAALRRFASRRGKPANIFSDNGTNFVGGNNELERLGNFLINESESLNESISNIGIQWHFIPAYAPHFGGIWEAGVKSFKYHLKRVAGDTVLTFEEFYTLLVQIESILNSRPLTPLSSDPNDLYPLTPAHFLIGRTFTGIADPDLTHIKEGRTSNWQHIQQLQQHLWKRWNKEYISELQTRTKWKVPYPTIKENTLVLLKEDKTPPSTWLLGRILEFHPGKDGIARIASVKTAKGVVRRAFTKLCPLPDCA